VPDLEPDVPQRADQALERLAFALGWIVREQHEKIDVRMRV
jgi:hypothetical protein